MHKTGDPEEPVASAPGSDGFTLIELVVAVSLLAVVAGGFVASFGLGFQTIAVARQRQIAASVVEARLEHLRSIPYTQLALSTAPVHSSDPANPDSRVSVDGIEFDSDGKGALEPLVVDPAGGVLHFETIQVGTTVLNVYQYVTWVDDPAIPGTQDYRRATVIVDYQSPALNGISKEVSGSAIFSTGTVSIAAATSSVPPTTTPPTTVPSTTTTVGQGTCPGDNSAPSGTATINGTTGAEAGFTAGANVTLNLSLTDPCKPIQARVGNSDGTWGSWTTYDPLNPSLSWAVTAGDGTKQVNVQASDAVGNSATIAALSIVVDTTKPTQPATLSRSVSCGGTRTVTMSWGSSFDTNFRGYRVYRSTDGVSWSVFTQVAQTTATDNTLKKTLDSVRYYVVAYDKAGNESTPTNTIALSKNQCS